MTALTPPAHVSGTIRQLEWVLTRYTTTDDDGGPREGIPRKLNAWKADRYLIIKQDSLNGLFILKGDEGRVGLATAYLKTAKAAAQADYEARIRGEIQPDAEPQPVAGRKSDDWRNGFEVGWSERLKQERNNAEVTASRAAPPTSAGDAVSREAVEVIRKQGVEWTASAMLLHIAEVLEANGGATLSAIPGHDFGTQVLEFAAALRALGGEKA